MNLLMPRARVFSSWKYFLDIRHSAKGMLEAAHPVSETIAASCCCAGHAAGSIKDATSEPTGSLPPWDTGWGDALFCLVSGSQQRSDKG